MAVMDFPILNVRTLIAAALVDGGSINSPFHRLGCGIEGVVLTVVIVHERAYVDIEFPAVSAADAHAVTIYHSCESLAAGQWIDLT